MKSFYFDTSALVKLYVEEEGSDKVLSIAEDRERSRLVVLDIARIELRSAVRQRQRDGDIDEADAAALLKQFDQDGVAAYVIQPLNANVMQEAARLLDKHPLKTQEALQLAGCLSGLRQCAAAGGLRLRRQRALRIGAARRVPGTESDAGGVGGRRYGQRRRSTVAPVGQAGR